MRAVNIADLNNNLRGYLDEVLGGAEVLVKDRNKPIARIVPLTAEGGDEAELMELIAAGIARLPRNNDPLPGSFWSDPLPKTRVDLPVAKIVAVLR